MPHHYASTWLGRHDANTCKSLRGGTMQQTCTHARLGFLGLAQLPWKVCAYGQDIKATKWRLRVAFDKKLRAQLPSHLPIHHTPLRGGEDDGRDGGLPVHRAQRALLLRRSRMILWGGASRRRAGRQLPGFVSCEYLIDAGHDPNLRIPMDALRCIVLAAIRTWFSSCWTPGPTWTLIPCTRVHAPFCRLPCRRVRFRSSAVCIWRQPPVTSWRRKPCQARCTGAWLC
jgi:hypothetical protein